MNYFAEVTKSNIDEYLREYSIIACRIRNSRIKSKQIAILEMIFAQFDNEILAVKNGPLGDIKGIVSFFCPKKNLFSFRERLFGIGYCYKFYLLDFEDETCKNPTDLRSINPLIWKGRKFSVDYFYTQDSKIYEEQSPHKREFKIAGSNGEVKTVFGYRGDGSELGRRSLPVEDARCMVNLSIPAKNKRILDPFAGGGGIVFTFRYIAPNGTMASIDIDPVLKPGLEFYSSAHYVMNAKDASFPPDSFDSVITEVPFSKNALNDITIALAKINASVSNDGIFVIMCEKNQRDEIFSAMSELGIYLLFNSEIDRKGTDVDMSVLCKSENFANSMSEFIGELKKIY
ncbi:MAG: hypothetical protein LBQ82_07875 [Treponema sp.]|jgi:hypothetical protein|nr:hypothetical protein [Treponema sp.]